MGSLSEFQELVNDLKDEQLLDVAESLLKDMVEIQNMKEKIDMLEETLTKGDRAAFWWFAMGLDRDQVDLATNTVMGRKRFLKDQADRLKLKEEVAALPADYVEPKKKYKRETPLPEEQVEAEDAEKIMAEMMAASTALIAQARAGMSAEDSDDLDDEDVLDMIREGEGGLDQLIKKLAALS